ncbi:MAG: L28 family ribosomal protein [bacterium]|nr:L28 family ribosomal protein [bacterium]
MTRQCTTCNRSSIKVVSRSHSNQATLRRQYVNLQRRWIDGTQTTVCTKCIKTLKRKGVLKTGKK